MKIGLMAIGNDNWMGGVYYIHNLVHALRALPADEQPEILLVMRPDVEKSQYSDLEDLVDFYPRGVGPEVQSFGKMRKMVVHKCLNGWRGFFVIARLLNKYLMKRRYRGLVEPLRARDARLIFPCMANVGENYQLPWMPWVWDLQHKHYSELFTRWERRERDVLFESYGRDARLVVTSSETTIGDYNKHYPGHEGKLRALRFRTVPADSWYRSDARAVANRYGLPARYLMIPNQFFAHKNHIVAIEALDILKRRGREVVIACTGNTNDWRRRTHHHELVESAKAYGLESQFISLGLLPRIDQIQLLRCADAVLQPSLFEGWSTVVEDARALGKRVFLSDIPVHREQNPPGVVYFDPNNPADLADSIDREWKYLAPGPDESGERVAAERQKELVAIYARDFLKIANELVGCYEQ